MNDSDMEKLSFTEQQS